MSPELPDSNAGCLLLRGQRFRFRLWDLGLWTLDLD